MKIAFVISKNMLVTSLTNAYELLFAAIQAAKAQSTAMNVTTIKLVKVSQLDKDSPHTVSMPSGLSLQADTGLDDCIYDMVYVPALWRNPRPVVRSSQPLVTWLRRQHEHGAIINAVGTGVCLLAQTGLLDHKPATTHWYYLEQFANDYPLVQLKRQHFITNAGNLYCAASINALTDLTLHHIHRFFNHSVAQHLERHFSHEIRQDFDKISYSQDENTNHPDETILQAQLWLQNNLNKNAISIEQLADLFGMSQRNFTRRFKAATNITPVQYLQNQRLQLAKELLQTSNLSISEIAYRVGYLDVSYFSKLFKSFASISPKEYRTMIRAKLFST